jgi:hypothetical protein
MTKEEREHLGKWIKGSLENGQYRPLKSQYASPMFFKHKTNPDGDETVLRLHTKTPIFYLSFLLIASELL